MSVFLENLLHFVSWILTIYMWVVIIAALITFVRPDPYNPIVQFLFRATEPVYARIRRFIPTTFGGLDIAPMIVILAIALLQQVVIGSLLTLLAR